MKVKRDISYTSLEEKINIWSHAAGILLSLVGMTLLIMKAVKLSVPVLHWVAYLIYGVSQVAVFSASTLYHSSQNEKLRRRLNVFDHSAIYLSIAGSYTPFTLIFIKGVWGWSIFGSAWLIALAGIVLKLFYTGRFRLVSTISYVVMGWIIVIAINPLIKTVPFFQLMWILSGALFYTLGAALYQIKRIPYNHAIFHFFVLAGAISIFIAIYTY